MSTTRGQKQGPETGAPSPSLASAGMLSRPDGSSIAYRRLAGKLPGVVFLHGLRSDMNGDKALRLEAYCQERGQAFLRFDQFGHGTSSGDFAQGLISRWAEDTVAVLDSLTDGPQILVGSSLGGWLMVLAALARPERVAGLVGIAAAPDFTEDQIRPALTAQQRHDLDTRGYCEEPSSYSPTPDIYTRAFLDDGEKQSVLRRPAPFLGPVRLLHGLQDTVVPWRRSVLLAEHLDSQEAQVIAIKSGDHRLSRPQDLELLCRTLDTLLETKD